MITEFSFSGFPHPGHQSSLFVDVYTQGNRGVGYRQYVLQAARAPFMVGMHWFMWMDYARQSQAIHGFPPDENVGLVSNDEAETYEELGRWVKVPAGGLLPNTERRACHCGDSRPLWMATSRSGRKNRPLSLLLSPPYRTW
jgi:hypothetical protein